MVDRRIGENLERLARRRIADRRRQTHGRKALALRVEALIEVGAVDLVAGGDQQPAALFDEVAQPGQQRVGHVAYVGQHDGAEL